MSHSTRVLKTTKCEITYKYNGSKHNGIDLTGAGHTLDSIVAHSDGTVVGVVSNVNYNTSKTGKRSYGNYVKIKHDNGMFTLYAHIKHGTVSVKVGDRVSRGQVLGYMGNTGYSFGAHVHFEVRDVNNNTIDSTPYINADLPTNKVEINTTYKVGDTIKINGVYTNSNSDNRLAPAVTTGTITRIVEGARNPYLLNYGNIGWVNEECIVKETTSATSGIRVGDKVRVKKGARSYKGVALASFIYKNVYDVIEVNGNRAVIGKGQAVTTDIHVNNLYK